MTFLLLVLGLGLGFGHGVVAELEEGRLYAATEAEEAHLTFVFWVEVEAVKYFDAVYGAAVSGLLHGLDSVGEERAEAVDQRLAPTLLQIIVLWATPLLVFLLLFVSQVALFFDFVVDFVAVYVAAVVVCDVELVRKGNLERSEYESR